MNCDFFQQESELVCTRCGFRMRHVPGKVLRNCGNPANPSLRSEQITDISTPSLEPLSGPCIHRGESLRIEKCKPCQSGGITPEVFACAVHGECTLYTISKRKPDGSRWPACSTCEQRGT